MDANALRDWLRDREAAYAQLRHAVEVEAIPALTVAWEASPGRVEGLNIAAFVRVGLVERRVDARGTFDLVWLDFAAWRPFEDTPEILLEARGMVNGRWVWALYLEREESYRATGHSRGVEWLREVGRPGPGYLVPWCHCGINQRAGVDEEGRVDHMAPGGDVDAHVFPAARAWIDAYGVDVP